RRRHAVPAGSRDLHRYLRQHQPTGHVAAASRNTTADGASTGSSYPRSTAMNCTEYWHQNAWLGGIQSAGSSSPLFWLASPATAIRLAGALAKRVLGAPGKSRAPRSHANASGTMWSICTASPTFGPRVKWMTALVYGSYSVPVATAFGQRLMVTYVLSTKSRSRMSLRVSHPLWPPDAALSSVHPSPKAALR